MSPGRTREEQKKNMGSTSFTEDIGGLYKNMKVMAINKIYGSSKDVNVSEMSR